MSKIFDDYYDDLIQKNTSSLAYPSKKLLAHSAWDAAQQAMLDEFEQFLMSVYESEEYVDEIPRKKIYEQIFWELKQKYRKETK